jgi:hypothetical protein
MTTQWGWTLIVNNVLHTEYELPQLALYGSRSFSTESGSSQIYNQTPRRSSKMSAYPPEKAGLPGTNTLPHRSTSGASVSDDEAVPEAQPADV